MDKFLAILAIVAGEIFTILAEIISAKYYAIDTNSFTKTFLRSLPLILPGVIFLVTGYMLGLKAFKNIWIVSVISITSILIIEPIVNYTITGQLPTRGAWVGLIFGATGLASALLF